jgi:hypothetical protein
VIGEGRRKRGREGGTREREREREREKERERDARESQRTKLMMRVEKHVQCGDFFRGHCVLTISKGQKAREAGVIIGP